MKIELVISGVCPFCLEAEKIWRATAADQGFEFFVLDISKPEGAALAQRIKLQTVPAILIDNILRAVGVQSADEALILIKTAGQEVRGRM